MCHLQHFNCCLVRKWGMTIETLVSRYHVTEVNYELDILLDSDSEKEKYFRGGDTATHAISPPLQHFKPMKAVGFV